MNVVIDNRQGDLPLNEGAVPAIVNSVLELESEEADEVGIHFVDVDEICALHAQYFSDPSPTDCISLPIEGKPPYRLLGDVFVCPKTALLYIEEHGGDPYRETALYLVHGLLHLLGYDDKEKGAEVKMRGAERRALKHLNERGITIKP